MSVKIVDITSATQSPDTKDEKIDFDWVMESAVYGIKNSLALLQCMIEQQHLTAESDAVSDAVVTEPSEINQVSIIQRETSRIDNDTTQLLALYRIHNSQLSLRIEEVDIRSFLEEAVVANQVLFSSSKIQIDIDCEEDLIGFFDPCLVRSVLHTAIVGGVKYTKSYLRLCARSEGDAVVLSLEDDGVGYPESLRLQYAERQPLHHTSELVRAHLNFYFASCVAHQHKNAGAEGFIRLASTANGGGVFEITIP